MTRISAGTPGDLKTRDDTGERSPDPLKATQEHKQGEKDWINEVVSRQVLGTTYRCVSLATPEESKIRSDQKHEPLTRSFKPEQR